MGSQRQSSTYLPESLTARSQLLGASASFQPAREGPQLQARASRRAHENSGRQALPAMLSATTLETLQRDASIQGEVPSWLRGTLLRTTPAQFQVGAWEAAHWFDALGMMYRFSLHANGSVEFAQRMLESEHHAALQRGERVHASFATATKRSPWRRAFEPIPLMSDNTNVNVTPIGGQAIAMTETPHQLAIDLQSLAVQERLAWTDRYQGLLTIAHPAYDSTRKRVVTAGLAMAERSPHVALLDYEPSSRERRVFAKIARRELPYVHELGVTPEHAVLIHHPFTVAPLGLLWSERGILDHFRWRPERGTQLIRVDRRTGQQHVHQAPACFVFHVVHAYETPGATVMEVVAHVGNGIVEDLRVGALCERVPRLKARHLRWTMRHGSEEVLEEQASQVPHEFPSVAKAQVWGRPHEISWGAVNGPDEDGENRVIALDVKRRTQHSFGAAGWAFGEPIFVAPPNCELVTGASVESNGVILSVATSLTEHRTRLYVLASASLEPRAFAEVDTRVPLGFHGRWFGGAT